jgi:hypothetical protein
LAILQVIMNELKEHNAADEANVVSRSIHTRLPGLYRRRHKAKSHVRPHRHLPPHRSS